MGVLPHLGFKFLAGSKIVDFWQKRAKFWDYLDQFLGQKSTKMAQSPGQEITLFAGSNAGCFFAILNNCVQCLLVCSASTGS